MTLQQQRHGGRKSHVYRPIVNKKINRDLQKLESGKSSRNQKCVSIHSYSIFGVPKSIKRLDGWWLAGGLLAFKDNLSSQILRWWAEATATRLLLSDKVFLCDSSGTRFPSLLTVCKSGMHRICVWKKRSSIDRWRRWDLNTRFLAKNISLPFDSRCVVGDADKWSKDSWPN